MLAHKYIKSAVRWLSDQINPEDKETRVSNEEKAKAWMEAQNARNVLPRTPISTHTIIDAAEFHVSEGWFSVRAPYSEILTNLNTRQRMNFMNHLTGLIVKTAKDNDIPMTPRSKPKLEEQMWDCE